MPIAQLLCVVSYAVVAFAAAVVLGARPEAAALQPAHFLAGLVFLVLLFGHEVLARRRDRRSHARDLAEERRARHEAERDLAATLHHLGGEVEGLRNEVARVGALAMAAGEPPATAVLSEMRVLRGELERLGLEADRLAAVDAGTLLPAGRPDLDPAKDKLLLAEVRGALESNRVDLYLQPVVSLPQRRVRYYEAFSRLRSVAGEIIAPDRFLPAAEAAGLMPAIDNLLLFRCVQLVRRVQQRKLSVAFFVNIASDSLSDTRFFDQFVEFLQANKALADDLIFEMSQADLDAVADPAAMAALAELGFRFSMDRLQHLNLDAERLARRGVRFVKVPAVILLSDGREVESRVHPADLKEVLRRANIDLVVSEVESERDVVELLELGVDYGQGFLFGAPRLSRPEAQAA